MRRRNVIVLVLGMVACAYGPNAPAVGKPPTREQIEKMKAAAPAKATVRPHAPRKLLVFTLCKGFRHSSVECGAKALEIMGEKTGAYQAVVSDDLSMFAAEQLRQFDAVCFGNTTGELFDDAKLKKSFLAWVKSGEGVIGLHAATDCFYNWPEFGKMMGGYFDGHPWHEQVTIKLDEPDHPINAAFEGKPFEVVDEIYQFREPYSREKLRVLLSLDTNKTDMGKQGIRRDDRDFAVSWVREYGKGRVFYCSLGHREEIFWNPTVLRHYLDGIQFALGDLKADATPLVHGRDARATQSRGIGWGSLFNGRDLTGWKGLVGNPVSRAKMSPDDRADVQAMADEKMPTHWQVEEGVLVFDGKGDNICTVKDYGDFELLVDWKIEPGGDSGIYLRGTPQVQIWDRPEGSGGLYNNQNYPSKPTRRADKPVGEWNTFRIKMIGDRVTVILNDVLVALDVPLENYWERGKPTYTRGQIELQAHYTPLYFKNIKIREIPAEEVRQRAPAPGWAQLFNGRDLTGWTCKPDAWVVEEGVLTRKGGSDIWTEDRFGDFILELEFRLDHGTNSGIFFRTADIRDCVQTGIEIQVLDSYGKDQPGKHDCGAIYDCAAPRKNMVKKTGEWNHLVLTCRGGMINVVMNGEEIIDMNLDEWTEPHKNPDGSKNKFRTAYRDMPRVGHIGFQDHGSPIWYRNIRILPLAK
ncbi:MAG: family 16 glycoside hydrolase [Phycisphaerae bacterium]